MTTIAVSRTEMACDSRTSWDGGDYLTCDDKVERIGDALVGCCGNVDSIFKFLAWFRSQEKDRPEFGDDDNFVAIVLTRKGIFHYTNATYPSRVCDPFVAFGTGSMAAKAAMLCGKTPAEAVAIAIKCDKNSGGPVRNYVLRD
jgi:hypothetical protein